MILVDTSIWIDHFRNRNETLARLLDKRRVLVHPFVVGELALGNLRQREIILDALQDLPGAVVAHNDEVLRFIEQHSLFGQGIGYIDAHVLAAVRLTPDASLWTRDKRLLGAAHRLSLAVDLAE